MKTTTCLEVAAALTLCLFFSGCQPGTTEEEMTKIAQSGPTDEEPSGDYQCFLFFKRRLVGIWNLFSQSISEWLSPTNFMILKFASSYPRAFIIESTCIWNGSYSEPIMFTVSTFGTRRGELGVESWWILEGVVAPTSSCRGHRKSALICDS